MVLSLRVEYLGKRLMPAVGDQLTQQQSRQQRPRRRHGGAGGALASRPEPYHCTSLVSQRDTKESALTDANRYLFGCKRFLTFGFLGDV